MSGFSRGARLALTAALAVVLSLTTAQQAFAVKANPKPVTYYQPDGTPFQVRMIGDERVVFVEDTDGHTIVRDASTGWYVYADPASHKSQQLRPSKYKPGKEKAPAAWNKHVRPAIDVNQLPGPPFTQQDDGSVAELFRNNKAKNNGRYGISTSAVSLTPTTVPVLVILVEFSDWKHTNGTNIPGEPGFEPIPGMANSAPTWQKLLGDPTVEGGLNHFYNEASYGRFQWNVTVAQRGKGQAGTGTLVNDGWYTNPQTMAYWGKSGTTMGQCDEDKGTSTGGIKDLITWAVQQADADVNFAAYDTNGNGSISDAELMIFVVHAREGQEYYGSGCDGSDPGNQHIWSHKWNMRVNVAVDGKTIPAGHIYAIEPEFNPTFNYATTPWGITEKFFGVGVYAHEALHTLGAPDIYDTGSDSVPAGEWELMDSGSYNGAKSGTHPAHMGTPLKQDLKLNADTDAASYGFLLESEIKDVHPTDGVYNVAPLGGTSPVNVLHRVKAPNDVDEWFMVENRAAVGYYEKYLPEFGLVIWHRDRSVAGSSNSTYPYQTNVLRKGWANTATGLNAPTAGAALSADDNETSFTATTDPHNKLNAGGASGIKDIRCISAEASAMSFVYGTATTAHVSYAGSSTSGGDGDEWIDFGETASITVRVSNSSCAGASASNIAVALSSANAVVGGASPATVSSLAPGQTAEFTFPVQLSCTTCQSASFDYTITVGGVTLTSGAFAKDTNRNYFWLDDGDAQAKAGWTSATTFVPSACTSAARHGNWSLVPHPTAARGNSYRAPVTTGNVTYANPDEVWVSPNILIPAGTNVQELRFSLAAEIPCVNYSRGRLWTSTDNGATWTRNEDFYKDGGDLSWEEVRVSLANLAGATQVKLMFAIYTYTCQTGCTATRGMYVDNIGLVVAQTAPVGPDTIAPVTAITAPAAGATVSGTTTVSASASDNVAVTSVEFYVDGVLAATDNSSPYSFSWNTTTAADGSHSLSSKAYDAAGNVGTSASVSVTVDNSIPADTTAPTTAITSPAGGATVSGSVNVTASASDAVGVTNVEFYVDGVLAGSDSSAPYAFSWNTLTAANGSHSLSSKAYDAAGNVGTSASVSVTVNNQVGDTTPPVISGVTAVKITNTSFEVRWTTNEPASSDVIIGTTTYADPDPANVTSHVRSFSGAKRNTTYTYYVRSTDAAGNTSQAGPFTHRQ